MLKTFKNLILVGFASLVLIACSQQGGGGNSKKSKTLENTKKAGFVKCGVSQGLPGFSNADAAGNWTGIDCLLYTSPSPRDAHESRMPSSA